jgi:hypothetical protein
VVSEPADPAPNDDFADAADLGSGENLLWQARNDLAGAEDGEPNHAGRTAQRSIWYRWTAPRDGDYFVGAASSEFGAARFAVYRGDRLDALESAGEGSTRAVFSAQAGESFAIAVDGDAWGGMTLELHPVSIPANDDFAGRIRVEGSVFVLEGDFAFATAEDGEPRAERPQPTRTLWWEWTAPAGGSYRFSRETGYGAAVSIFKADSDSPELGDLVSVHSTSSLKAGTTYYLRAGDNRSLSQARPFRWVVYQGSRKPDLSNTPPNDMFSSRTDLGSDTGVMVAGDLYGATPDLPLGDSRRSVESNVWWSWTAPDSGDYVLDAFSGDSGSWHTVTVYRGGDLLSLEALGRIFGGGSVCFEADTGGEYAVEWRAGSTVRSDAGSRRVGFVIKKAAAPDNDAFSTPRDLPSAAGEVVEDSGSTAGAGAEAGEPAHAGSAAGRSVWFRWTAPGTGQFQASLSATGEARMAVYAGDALASLTEVASGGGGSVFDAEAGRSYRIAVDSSKPVCYVLKLGGVTPESVLQNDDFADALVLSGSSGEVAGTTKQATLETAEPMHSGRTGAGGSAWWRWTAPQTGWVEFSVGTDHVFLSIYQGDDLLSLVAVTSREKIVRFLAGAGEEYRIAVSEEWKSSNGHDLGLRFGAAQAPPANDEFSAAEAVAGDGGEVAGTLTGASAGTGDPVVGWQDGGPTVWYRWAPSEQGPAAVRILEGGDVRISLFRGDALGNLEPIGASGETLAFLANPGEEIHVMVNCAVGESVDFRLAFECIGVSANDDFEDAAEIGSAETFLLDGMLLGSGYEREEPDSSSEKTGGSLWWKWTAPGDGGVAIEVVDENGVPKTGSVGFGVLGMSGGGGWNGLAQMSRVEAGGSYWIRVYGDWAEGAKSGAFRLRFFWAPLLNDDFANRIALPSGLPSEAQADALGAGSELWEPDGVGAQSVWWDWTAAQDGWVEVDLSQTETVVGLWIGTGANLAMLEAMNLSEAASGVWLFRAEAGVAYHIAVSRRRSLYNAPALRSVKMVLREAELPANDMFREALPLVGDAAHLDVSALFATREPGEPQTHSWDSLWWRWTAPRSGIVRFANGERTRSLLYRGSGWDDLEPVPGFRGVSAYHVEAGESYWLAAGPSWSNPDPEDRVRVDLLLGPVADCFAEAEDLGAAVQVSRSGTLAGCFWEEAEPPHAGEPPRNSYWYRWTAPKSGRVNITVGPQSGGGPPFWLAVCTGGDLRHLREAAGGVGEVGFQASVGTEYRIVLDGDDPEHPEYRFELAFEEETPPGYAEWRARHFADGDAQGAPSADPDRDGRDNLMELTLGGDPLAFDAGVPFTVDSWGGYVRLNVRRPAGLEGWWHRFDVSADMVRWLPTTELGRLQSIEDHGDGTETFHVILTDYRISEHPRLYFRLIAGPGEDPLGP